MDKKATNPKDAIATTKVQIGTVSAPVMWEMGLAKTEGALKYGAHNHRAIGVRASVYYAAAIGHLQDWWEGEDLDPDCPVELNHIIKAMASLEVIMDAIIQDNWVDDRPPKSPKGWKKNVNARAKVLIEGCEKPVEPYTAIRMQPGMMYNIDLETGKATPTGPINKGK